MPAIASAFRFALLAAVAVLLSACETPVDVTSAAAREPLGDFKLGFAVAYADNAEKGPLSRDASEEEWETAIKAELQRVFGGYEGTRYYHLSLTVNGYVLAQPGIPVVASPKSALIVSLFVWDDKTQTKLVEDEQFTITENLTGRSILGSGLTKSREEQLDELTKLAVGKVYDYLRENKQLFNASGTAATDT